MLLSTLRQVAGPLLEIDRETVSFTPHARDRVDVHRFDRLADRAEATVAPT